MSIYLHLDEARETALAKLTGLISEGGIDRAVLIDDLFGKLRVVLWATNGEETSALVERVRTAMAEVGHQFWTDTIWIASDSSGVADQLVYAAAWDDGKEVTDRLRVHDRHRSRTAWFTPFRDPPWEARRTESAGAAPPIVAFLSFKGGVGRTTALASFAIQRARAGQRVAVVDFDLDAPGVGTLLATDDNGTTAPWGVVDYLLERSISEVPLEDYVHRCPSELSGNGAILVVPAGRVNPSYLTKLARVDLEIGSPTSSTEHPSKHPFELLLAQIRAELAPDWILIDARAGLSPAAGLLTSGFAHLYVLFSTSNEQSLIGLERVVHRLGVERLSKGPQAECFVVHAMVPENPAVAAKAIETFRGRTEEIFRSNYLVAEDPTEELWSVADIGNNSEAPHVPVEVPYSQGISFFSTTREIADVLCQGAYELLSARIQGRFPLIGNGTD